MFEIGFSFSLIRDCVFDGVERHGIALDAIRSTAFLRQIR